MSEAGQSILDLQMMSDPGDIAEVRKTVEQFCIDQGMEQPAVSDIGLCVNEALANVIRHAYDGQTDRQIHLKVENSEGAIRVFIRDWGKGIDPLKLPPKPENPEVPGGLGMICLKQLSDRLRFEPQADGMLLILEKLKHASG